MNSPHPLALTAWKNAEVEAQDAYAALRIEFMKYVEGISGPPSEDLLEKSMTARIRVLASMLAVIRGMH